MLALEINQLSKQYKKGVKALTDVSIQVKEKDFFALLGPNGAGKSTLIGIIGTLVTPTAGEVKVFDVDLLKHPSAAKRYVGIVPQEVNFNTFEKVDDIIMNQAGYYGIPRSEARITTDHYLKQLGLWEKRHAIARTLSGGMKRRLMIARGLVHKPKLLILDEPTAGVDIELRRHMWSFLQEINEQGVTIILTTHYLEEAEQLCKNVAIIDHGQLITNTSIKALLAQTHEETLIIDVSEMPENVPVLEGFQLKVVDPTTIEVTYKQGCNLNNLFLHLDQLNVTISSMRHKTNRLEELFLQLTTGTEV